MCYIFVCVCVYVRVCKSERVRVHVCNLIQHAKRTLSCHLWRLWLHHIFRYYLINGMIFEKRVQITKCVF